MLNSSHGVRQFNGAATQAAAQHPLPRAASRRCRGTIKWQRKVHCLLGAGKDGLKTSLNSPIKSPPPLPPTAANAATYPKPQEDPETMKRIQAILDDQIVKIQAMSASPFAKPFKDQVNDLETMMQTLQDLIDN